MYDLICKLHEANLDYLKNKPDLTLPTPYQPDENTGQWVSPSRMGRCPAVKWHEIHDTPSTVQIPDWKAEKNAHRMHHGSVWGRELQKAFAYHFGLMRLETSQGVVRRHLTTWQSLQWWAMDSLMQDWPGDLIARGDFAPEVYVQNDPLGVRGFIDGVVRFNDELWLVEIKTRDYGQGVRKTDVYQLLAYLLATGCPNGLIITTGHAGFKCWPVTPEGAGFMVRTEGQAELLDEAWNTPDTLNFEVLRAEIERHKRTLSLDRYRRPEAPLNPLDLANFECLEWVQKPRWFKTKPAQDGTFVPSCPYFGVCHPHLAGYPNIVVGINADQQPFIKEEMEALTF